MRSVGRVGSRVALPLGLAAVVGGAGFGGYQWVKSSDRFAISDLDVRGTSVPSEPLVRTELERSVIGHNLFEVDIDAVERRLTTNPWVESADVSRRLPDRLIVEIVPRKAAALVELGGFYLADEDGAPFKRAQVRSGEGSGLPIVTGLAREDYLRNRDQTHEQIRRAIRIAEIYSEREDRPRLGEIRIQQSHGIVLRTYETALAIRLGSGSLSALEQRLRTFDTVWAALSLDERADTDTIHLDNATRPDRVTVAFARTGN